MSSTHDHSFSGLRLATLVAALTLTALTLDRDAFAEDAAILTAPQELHAGGRSSLTLVTLDSATRAPISREATIELRRGGVVVAELFRGKIIMISPPCLEHYLFLSKRGSGHT